MNQSFAIAMLLATLGAGALHAEDVPDISPKAVDAINALQELGSFDEAAQAAQMLVAARGRALGPEAPETLRARILLAQVVSEQLWVTGETETQLRELLPVATKVFGAQQRETLVCLSTLAFVLASQGDNAAAEELCRGLIPIETKVLGAEDPETLKARRMHAKILHRLGKHEEAGRAESELLDFCQHAFGAEGKETLRIRVAMAATQGELHRPAAAEGELRALLPVLARVFGAEHYETQKAIDALTIVLRHQEKYAQAQQERQKWVDIATRILGPDGSHTLGLRLQQAEDLHAQGRDAEATQERQAVLAALDRTRGTEDRVTLRTCHLLALSLKQQNKTAEALPFAQRALEGRLKLLGSKAHDTDASQRLVNQLTYASPQDLKPKADAAGPDAKKRPVAMVDGALIFASDIRQLVEAQAEVLRYHHQSEPDRLARELAKLDRSALGILIDKHLLINEFNRSGRVVKAAFIDTDLDNLIKDGYKGSREAFLQELGQRGPDDRGVSHDPGAPAHDKHHAFPLCRRGRGHRCRSARLLRQKQAALERPGAGQDPHPDPFSQQNRRPQAGGKAARGGRRRCRFCRDGPHPQRRQPCGGRWRLGLDVPARF